MSTGDRSPTPPRAAERILELVVGSGEVGQSIVGDAREEFHTRGRRSRLGATVWYWLYVLHFAVTYRVRGRPSAWHGGLHGPSVARTARALARRPGFSAAVITTLGVGIGACTLTFALIEGVLLRPLPYPESERLVDVSRVNPDWFGGPPDAVQAANVFATPSATFFDWARMATSFEAIGAYTWMSAVL